MTSRKAQWIRVHCWMCRGTGIKGMDMHGNLDDCECAFGYIFVSDKDRLAAWPGGPFMGTYPGFYQKAVEQGLAIT